MNRFTARSELPELLFEKGDLPKKIVRIRQRLITCLLCLSVKFTAIFVRLIFAIFYFGGNNRGPPPKMSRFQPRSLLSYYESV